MRRWAAAAVGTVIVVAAGALCPPAWGAANRPFPQHRTYAAGSIAPSHRSQAQLDEAVRTYYGLWKQYFLRAGCFSGRYYAYIGPQPATAQGVPISVSEGQGYAMLIVAHMAGHDPDAQKIFDGLYRFYRDHPSQHDSLLMAWRQLSGCASSNDPNSATDGDIDIAEALLLADRQWGNTTGINYRYAARQMMAAIRVREVHPTTDLPQMGDWVHPDYPAEFDAARMSDLVPQHFRTFLAVSGDQGWRRSLDASYALLDEAQRTLAPDTGLVPDFVIDALDGTAAAPPNFVGDSRDGIYGPNACRMPWRVATDFLLNGEPRAKAVVGRLEDWVLRSTGGDIYRLYAEYRLDGTPSVYYNYVCTTGAVGVAAMIDARYQTLLNRIWDDIALDFIDTPSDYYGASLRMMYMLVMSRNWWGY